MADFLGVSPDQLKADISVEPPEHPDERTARISRENDHAEREAVEQQKVKDHERLKDFIFFCLGVGLIAAVFLLCVGRLMFLPAAESPWAAPLLTMIVGAVLGYQTGKTQTKSA